MPPPPTNVLADHTTPPSRVWRLLTYNVQAGIESSRYSHYLTNAWQHLLPNRGRRGRLLHVATQLAPFDAVALQEIDAGSLRTHFESQAHLLADAAGFDHWHQQINRRIGQFTRNSNGLLSRQPLRALCEYRLPGLKGRGAVAATIGEGNERVTLVCVHLSLGQRARARQLDFLAERIRDWPRAVILGDFNCTLRSRELARFVERGNLRPATESLHTYPSWRPRRGIDHVLLDPSLELERAYLPKWGFSDHRPVAVHIRPA